MKKISTMMFFPNGNFAAFDRNGEQVTQEQGSAWIRILQEKLDRGVITGETKVVMSGWQNQKRKGSGYDWTVQELIESKRLKKRKRSPNKCLGCGFFKVQVAGDFCTECDREGAKDDE